MLLQQIGDARDRVSGRTRAALLCADCGGAGAAIDTLTGLADRKTFHHALEARLREPRDAPNELALLLIDLDRFKAVNDTLGHQAGDHLLTAVGRRLRGVLRSHDVAARLGGDEFAVMLDVPAGRVAAGAIANRVVALLSQPFLIEGSIAQIGASIGIVELSDAGQGEATLLLRQADLAMYQAKAEGGSRAAFFEPELQQRAGERRLMELDLRSALALGQFEVFYQPQFDLQNNVLAGFEALIRWRHPVRGLVQPDCFIPLAETLGVINAIGAWVIGEACAEAMRWPGRFTVAVNVSPKQFDDDRLVSIVTKALAASSLPAARLELEITESALLRSSDQTLRQLNAIKAMGVQVSLDDFGTGFSSLTQLRSFPFDRVKIDRSFVEDGAVIRAITVLGRSLGMRTTAEGIETPEQMARLRTDGCTEIQGYLLSRPVPREEVAALIEQIGLDHVSTEPAANHDATLQEHTPS